jgi:hypothetical protein
MKPKGTLIIAGVPAGDTKAAPAISSGSGQTDSVPLSSLAMPDDSEQMTPPAVGDEVNYQVAGKVVSIEGDIAQVQRTSINGQPVKGDGDGDEAEASPDDDQAEAALRGDAAGMDAQGVGLQ